MISRRRLSFPAIGVLALIALPGPLIGEAPDPPEGLTFVRRQQQNYTLVFRARPDRERFQITRVPTMKWPDKQNFLLKVGESSEDGQFRVESLERKEALNALGIVTDASELTITHLPSGKKVILARGVEQVIPTYFAEFRLGERTFYVKEGDVFTITEHPNRKFPLLNVKEEFAEISSGPTEEDPEKIKLRRTP